MLTNLLQISFVVIYIAYNKYHWQTKVEPVFFMDFINIKDNIALTILF